MIAVESSPSESSAAIIADVLAVFDEVRHTDPRLIVVLAAGRIEDALTSLVMERMTFRRGRAPSKFSSRLGRARDGGLVDDGMFCFVESLRVIRNVISHRHTTRQSMREGELYEHVETMHAATSAAWQDAPSPADDFQRSVFTSCLLGTLAAELTLFDGAGNELPKSFRPLARCVDIGSAVTP